MPDARLAPHFTPVLTRTQHSAAVNASRRSGKTESAIHIVYEMADQEPGAYLFAGHSWQVLHTALKAAGIVNVKHDSRLLRTENGGAILFEPHSREALSRVKFDGIVVDEPALTPRGYIQDLFTNQPRARKVLIGTGVTKEQMDCIDTDPHDWLMLEVQATDIPWLDTKNWPENMSQQAIQREFFPRFAASEGRMN